MPRVHSDSHRQRTDRDRARRRQLAAVLAGGTLLGSLALVACKSSESTATVEDDGDAATSPNLDADTRSADKAMAYLNPLGADAGAASLGFVSFLQTDAGVEVQVVVSGLAQGAHAVRIGNGSSCDSGAAGWGTVFDPTGVLADAGGAAEDAASDGGDADVADAGASDAGTDGGLAARAAGALGNVSVSATGDGSFTTTSAAFTVTSGTEPVLGRTVVVYDGADDGSAPMGGSPGAGVACGVIVHSTTL